MKISSRFLVGIFFLSLLWVKAIPASENEEKALILNLKSCIDMAVKNDPEVNNALDKTDIGYLKKKKAKRALLLPKLDFETTYGPKIDYFGRPITSDSIYRSEASIEKTLYKGGELVTGYKLGEKNIKIAKYDHRKKIADVMVETTEKYYNLLSAQEHVKKYKAIFRQTEQTVALIKEKFQIGATIRIEVLEAETLLNEIKYNLIRSQGNLKEAMAALNEQIGQDAGVISRVVCEFPIEYVPEDTRMLIAQAQKNRPDLLYRKEIVEYQKLNVDLNKSKYLPDLSLIGSYAWEGENAPGDEKEWSVMLNLSISLYDSTIRSSYSSNQIYENKYNFQDKDEDFDVEGLKLSIFDGSSNRVDLASSKAEYRLAKNRLEKLKRTIAKDVQVAVNKLREAESLQETAIKSIEYSEEKLKILEKKLQLRETSKIDVLEAQEDLIKAESKKLQAQYKYSIAIANLYKAIGKRLEWKGTSE